MDHALSRKKGGFIVLYHNQIRDESLLERNVKTTDEARVDIAARGFWISDQRAFFEIKNWLKDTKNITVERKDNIMSESCRTWFIHPVSHESPWFAFFYSS